MCKGWNRDPLADEVRSPLKYLKQITLYTCLLYTQRSSLDKKIQCEIHDTSNGINYGKRKQIRPEFTTCSEDRLTRNFDLLKSTYPSIVREYN